MSENENGIRITPTAMRIVVSLFLILSTLFSTGFYIVDRISAVEKKVEIECELRKRIEHQIGELDKKLEKILERLPER